VTKTALLLTLIVTAVTGMRRASLLCILALGLASTTAAQAQNRIFLTWPGIKGSVTFQGYVGSIELTSYMQNASNNRGNIVCGAVTISKFVDGTSPEFLSMMFQGTGSSSATVSFVHPPANTFYSITLNNVFPVSITQSDTASPNPERPLLPTDIHPPHRNHSPFGGSVRLQIRKHNLWLGLQ
jgi:type VI protein secretion system component Hcp